MQEPNDELLSISAEGMAQVATVDSIARCPRGPADILRPPTHVGTGVVARAISGQKFFEPPLQ